ncbi:MAG TPA: TadE family protein [Polyangiaceae bacterium]|nr:TadE family protein [Polyangiaceae bacterium]
MARSMSTTRPALRPKHAQIASGYDTGNERGLVYIEFLFAFVPLFLLFLGICQLALLHTAKLVVQHSAFAAVRSAIVVLDEPPDEYDGAARGDLTRGRTGAQPGIDDLLARVGVLPLWWTQLHPQKDAGMTFNLANISSGIVPKTQQGARMVPIRAAAYMPLVVLAPVGGNGNLAGSVGAMVDAFAPAALMYTKAASVVTIQAASGSSELAHEPIGSKAPVTVHVTYLYECGVPLVNAFMCSSLESLLDEKPQRDSAPKAPRTPSALARRLKLAESGDLENLVSPGEYFAVLDAEATLPNQGAAYEDQMDQG